MYNIIVCDNEKIICDSMAKIAAEFDYLNVFKSYSGQEALDIASNTVVDGILLDVRMPNMDGIETLKRLRENLKSDAVVIIIGGYGEF